MRAYCLALLSDAACDCVTDGGIDARVHGIKIVSLKEKEMGLNRDVLENKDALMRYPKLEEFSPNILYQKALVLQRSVVGCVCHGCLFTFSF